jgi:hypothetical protein
MRTLASALLKCEQHAAGHHGIISRMEALSLGMTKRSIDARLSSGAWLRVMPGVYRVASFPETWRGRLLAALLWAGPDAFVSHRSAAALYGLDGFREGPIEITAPSTNSIPGVKVYRSSRPARTRMIDGICVSWVDRTLLDVCAVADPTRCGPAMDDALRKRLIALDLLWAELHACGRGVRGVRVFRVLLEGRDDRDGKLQSRLEAKILAILREIKDETFEVQVPVTAGGMNYRLDFFHRRSVLGIEGHSFTWHFGKHPHDHDAERHNNLTLAGIRMLYITWDEATFKREEVRAMVCRAISSPL